jgi:hypothetical protein
LTLLQVWRTETAPDESSWLASDPALSLVTARGGVLDDAEATSALLGCCLLAQDEREAAVEDLDCFLTVPEQREAAMDVLEESELRTNVVRLALASAESERSAEAALFVVKLFAVTFGPFEVEIPPPPPGLALARWLLLKLQLERPVDPALLGECLTSGVLLLLVLEGMEGLPAPIARRTARLSRSVRR